MGKSPGKWIKTLLFGKKATRSNSAKGRIVSKAGNDRVAKEPPAPTENSPVISEPILVSTHGNGFKPELEKGNSSNLSIDVISSTTQMTVNNVSAGGFASNGQENSREEQAATKAQAAFRGFLARRAFRALKGIIRLQALVRGHLVRRQAIVTLHSILGIIKLQALARGKKVRSSGLGLEVHTKFPGKNMVPKRTDTMKGMLYSNAFVCRLLSSSLVIMPLQIQYDQGEPNSVFSWMERWTFSCFWKLPIQTKKSSDSKSLARKANSNYAMDTESGKSKRTVRKNSPANLDSTESEKPKRNVRKAVASDAMQDQPQSELEKVKRNLRKVTSSYLEITDKTEVKTNTQSSNANKVSDSKGIDSSEKTKKDITLIAESKPNGEIVSSSIMVEETVVSLVDNQILVEPNPLPSVYNNGNEIENANNSVLSGELSPKEEQTCDENQKNSRRRSSFSSKSEYAENGAQNSPTLPSYMQATESAKAKLRGQTSPRLGSDSNEKNGITRRHSLPSSSTNGKAISHSPRTQRILQAGVKGGIKSDRSFSSSRDANEKPIQVEWRR